MTALQIRGVPEDIRQTLADRAAARGQSLQAYLLGLVTEEAHRSINPGLLARFEGRRDGSQLTTMQVAEEVERGRAVREPDLGEAAGEVT